MIKTVSKLGTEETSFPNGIYRKPTINDILNGEKLNALLSPSDQRKGWAVLSPHSYSHTAINIKSPLISHV